jgi:hypothetical protein
MDRDSLIRFIEEAFDGVEQPHDITLHVAEAHDEYDYNHDEEHRRKDFFGPWQQVPAEHIRKSQEALSYVDKVGMRFYLPAYMVWYLRNLGNKEEVRSDHTLYSLDNHPSDPGLSAYHRERFSMFSPVQLKACALFIRFCAEDDSGFTDSEFARKKYERHWAQYETMEIG